MTGGHGDPPLQNRINNIIVGDDSIPHAVVL
jgi:hypothetical protein